MSDIRGILLDSNTLIYLINGDSTVAEILDKKSAGISFVTEIELLSWPDITASTRKAIMTVLDPLQYYDYSHRIKERTIEIRKQYRLKLGDAFVAATAIEHDLILVTADKTFSKVAELTIVNFVPSITL